MRRLTFGTATLVLLSALSLSACSQAQDAVQDAAGSAATAAASKAAEAGKKAAKSQLCKVLADGRVSGSESRQLDRAIDVADTAGVSPDLLKAARELADSSATAPPEAVAEIREQCA